MLLHSLTLPPVFSCTCRFIPPVYFSCPFQFKLFFPPMVLFYSPKCLPSYVPSNNLLLHCSPSIYHSYRHTFLYFFLPELSTSFSWTCFSPFLHHHCSFSFHQYSPRVLFWRGFPFFCLALPPFFQCSPIQQGQTPLLLALLVGQNWSVVSLSSPGS